MASEAGDCPPRPDIFGCPVQWALAGTCLLVLLLKRSRADEGLARPWVDFLLDASKQLVGIAWACLLSAGGLSALSSWQGGGCELPWVCTVVGTILGVLVEYVLLNLLSNALGWASGIRLWAHKIDLLREELDLDPSLTAQQVVIAASAERGLEPIGTLSEQVDRLLDELGLGCELLEVPVADFQSGDYRDIWGGLIIRKYFKQLLLWLGCVAGAKCMVMILLNSFAEFFVPLAGVLLMPVSWNPDLQLAVVAVLTPCCMEAFQAWATDEFLKKGGLPVSELRSGLTRRLKVLWESLAASMRRGSRQGELQQPLLRPETVSEVIVVEDSRREPCPQAKAVDTSGVDALPAGSTGTSADKAPHVVVSVRGPSEDRGSEAETPEVQRSAEQQAAAPHEEKLQEASPVQTQEQRLLGLEEQMAERNAELHRKLRELEDLRHWMTEQRALASTPQRHEDSVHQPSASPASPPPSGAPRSPVSPPEPPADVPQGRKDADEAGQQPALSRSTTDNVCSSPASQAPSGENIDQKIALLEAKIGELQVTRGGGDAIHHDFQLAGEDVIEEFLSGSRGRGGFASRVPQRGNLRHGR